MLNILECMHWNALLQYLMLPWPQVRFFQVFSHRLTAHHFVRVPNTEPNCMVATVTHNARHFWVPISPNVTHNAASVGSKNVGQKWKFLPKVTLMQKKLSYGVNLSWIGCMIIDLNLILGLAAGTDFKLAFINFKTGLWLPIRGA